ncbi:hypothetical protein PENARI_c047G03883 [Penicillium arizonense]|uniref:Uncharacterized protein n=1 Tax=Penicillium arizonense TaxID=1835702 RepID=A0A1F5L311_PENAI|nr:hypothetical protein PENARI_c047G03883 [Penicillium arizonense]OGE47369.1 hypothetical protein PENARI_c047G03883 [Penicillium arizonense]
MPRRSTRAQRRQSKRPSASNQIDVEQVERKQFDYRDSCFKGPFLVHLCDLDFGQSENRLIEDGNNVTRLTQILNIQGCLRLSREFHVPVVIDAADWLTKVNSREPTLVRGLRMDQLEIRSDYTLPALDHENVIIAARKMFKELQIEDPWWVADVYVTGANNDLALRGELVRSLQESFPNDQRPSDGRIYRNIRYYQGSFTDLRNETAESYWWALLESEPGSRKGDYLRTLPESLQMAFDALLPITGIWAGMSIGVLHKLKAMKCDEDILYLDVGQCVMRQLCFAPPNGNSTIDEVLRSQCSGFTSGLLSRSYWEQTVQNEQLQDLWRFSFQYAYELTPKRDHHRRVPRKNRDKKRAFFISANEELNGIPSLLLLRHFLVLARGYDFEVPISEGDPLSEASDLPRPHPCDFPPNGYDDVETERRSGRPFTDSVHADRFALSREALGQNWDFGRVSAGFVRRSVFRAFFSYLNAGIAESPH